jgi:hypothetical protein
VVFLSNKTFTKQILPKLVEKTKQKHLYVLLALEECLLATTFGLWMSMGAHTTFAVVVNFIYAYR